MKRITLVVTEDCNLDCKYCYVNKNKRKINEETVFKSLLFLKKQINNSPDPKQIILSGGEPFLQYALIKKIVALSKRIFKNRLFIGIPANGILLDKKKLDFIKKNNINLAISIDGSDEYNKNRVRNKNSNVFYLLNKKMPLFLEYEDIIRIRLTIAPELSKFLYKNFLYFYNKGFKRLDIQPVMGQYWSEKQIECYVSNFEKMINFSRKHKLDLKSFVDRIINLQKSNCCGKIDEEVMIDTKGDIYPCAFFLFFEPEKRKKFKIGNINNNFKINEKIIKDLKNFKMCSFMGKCDICKPSIACSKFCFCFNTKTRKKDKKIAVSNFILEKEIEQLVLKLTKNVPVQNLISQKQKLNK